MKQTQRVDIMVLRGRGPPRTKSLEQFVEKLLALLVRGSMENIDVGQQLHSRRLACYVSVVMTPQPYLADPGPDDYARAARSALAAKDFRQALEQAAAAVVLAPGDQAHLRLLDEIIGRTKVPLQVLKTPSGPEFFGLRAARARAQAKRGRFDEAITTLAEAVACRPSVPLFVWARAWVVSKRAKKVRADTVSRALVCITEALPGKLDVGMEENLEAALQVGLEVARRRGDEMLAIALSRVLRALGRYDAAALQLEKHHSSWAVAVEHAAICREQGHHSRRLEWLRRAAAANPDEPTTYLDIGDAHLDSGRLEEAIEAYDRAFDRHASSAWGVISRSYARALLDGDKDFDVSVALTDNDKRRAQALQSDLGAYETLLCEPTDPLIAVMRDVFGREGVPRRIVVHADQPLCPSARLAFEVGMQSPHAELEVQCARQAMLGPLWDPPNHQPPTPDVQAAVETLLQTPFAWSDWCGLAQRLAADLKGNPTTAMVNPAPLPLADIDPVRWVHATQIAAALLLAHGAEAEATRFQRLSALLEGRDDWSCAAALLGLRALARVAPSTRSVVLEACGKLLAEHNSIQPYSRALAVTGGELTDGTERGPYLALRARVRNDLLSG